MKQRLCWVDTKEMNHHSLWFQDGAVGAKMPGTFAYEGLIAKTRSQEFGDVHVELEGFRWLVVELKTWEDFHASVRDTAEGRSDSRLRHQLGGLLRMQSQGYRVAVMLVGTVNPAGGRSPMGRRSSGVYVSADDNRRRHKQSWSWHEVEATRLAVQQLGIVTYQAPSTSEIPHSLRLLAEHLERATVLEAPGLPRVATLGPRHSFLTTILTAVPGVGVVDGAAIASFFGTFKEFYEADITDLTRVKGVGKVTSQRIYAAFHGYEPDPEPVPIRERTLEQL